MKKNYIAPEAAIVNLAAETMLALSLPDGGENNNETIGSNARFEEDWEDEEF